MQDLLILINRDQKTTITTMNEIRTENFIAEQGATGVESL